MTTTRARLLDLSECQGEHVEFQEVRAAGYDGVVLKATEGAHYVDPDFDENVRRAHAAGLKVGAYLFLTTGSPVEDQVALFVGLVAGRAEFACVDMETPPPEQWVPPVTAEFIASRAAKACQLLAAVFTAERVAFYSYVYFLQMIARANPPSLALLLPFCLWIASYKDEKHEPSDHDQPTVPAPFTKWTLWQWSGDKGNSAPGVAVVVDHDVYNGTAEEFTAWATLPHEEVVEDTEPGGAPLGPAA